MSVPRGIRNKNPGNIERSHVEWYGEVRPPVGDPAYDERFCVFKEPVYGLRAMMKNLITYNQRRNVKTLREAINRWAPPHENDHEAYLNFVAKNADIKPDDEWDFTQRYFLVPVVKAMVIQENGWPSDRQMEDGAHEYWYSTKVYDEAYEMAVNGQVTSHTMNELPIKEAPEVFTGPRPASLWERILNFLKGYFNA